MKKSALIIVSSIAAQKYTPGAVIYSATKVFEMYLTVAVFEEFERFNNVDEQFIYMQCLCPGPVKTNILQIDENSLLSKALNLMYISPK